MREISSTRKARGLTNMSQWGYASRTHRSSLAQMLRLRGRSAAALKSLRRHPLLYLMVLPGVAYFVIFKIVPLLGCVVAWQDFNIFAGFFDSPWVGWKHFNVMFTYYDFLNILRNTLVISILNLTVGFLPPIILALVLNEIRNRYFLRTAQTLIYLPHFLSWVIVAQVFKTILSPGGGTVNVLLNGIFGIEPVYFMVRESLFPFIVVSASIWRNAGYSSIIYLASLAAIDPQLYESAAIVGANRWQQTWHITLPCLQPTMVTIFLLNIGHLLFVGFDMIYNLQNDLVLGVSDVFDTYLYRVGILGGQYSMTTAVGLFQSVAGFILLVGGNYLAKRWTGRGLFG